MERGRPKINPQRTAGEPGAVRRLQVPVHCDLREITHDLNNQKGETMRHQGSLVRLPILALAIVLIQGCAAVTRFEAASPGTTLKVRGTERMELPREVSLDSKATGQHEFVATAPSGKALYGILPLSVNGGKMAVSILFFAPALFLGGFRDVFPFYQMDPDAGLLRYKSQEREDWRLYQPTAAESSRAKQFFEGAGKP
jgi:hypothetical protein